MDSIGIEDRTFITSPDGSSLIEWRTRWTGVSCMLYQVDYFRSPTVRALRRLALECGWSSTY